MNKSQIPDVLKPVSRTTMSNVDIFTSVLEPVNKSQKRVIFNLRQQGILNAGSRLVMSLHTTNAVAGTAYLPVGAGIGACIDSAILRVGTRVIAKTENFGHYYMAKRSVHTHQQKQNIDMVLDGGVNNIGPSPNADGKYSFDVGSAIYTSKTTAFVNNPYKIVQSEEDCPTFSLALNDLFPMMRSNGLQLPLFAMKDQVSIEINLVQQKTGETGKNCLFSAAPTDSATTYGLNNFALHLDYLQYDDATMNKIRDMVNSPTGLPMIYDDLACTTTSIPAVAQPADNITTEVSVLREVGSAGLKVKNVLVVEKNAAANTLLGDYRSDSPVHPPKYNWRVNDRIIYPRKLFNTSQMRNEVEQVLKFPLSVPSCVYSHDVSNDFYTSKNGRQNEMLDANVIMEAQNPVQMAGTTFLTGLNLEKGPNGEGTDIHHKNILYDRTQTFSRNDFSAIDLKFFVEYERSFVLSQGVLLVSA